MKFLVDAQLPPMLATFLREQGHDAQHVIEIGFGESPDSALWRYAIDNHAVIVTKDEDFAFRLRQTNQSPNVIWIRVGNIRRGALLNWFKPMLPRIVELIDQGHRLVELR
jgi:predicted nuclease of predicted toxin-antitoxin system